MNWKLKTFEQLTVNELYQILKVRAEVFVVEQACVYQDIDSKDLASWHLFIEDKGSTAAYLRILPPGISYPEASIGRVLTKAEYRRRGLSQQLIKRAIDFIQESWKNQAVRISGQAYLLEFYRNFGFEPVSDIYLEDGIEHYEMLLRKERIV